MRDKVFAFPGLPSSKAMVVYTQSLQDAGTATESQKSNTIEKPQNSPITEEQKSNSFIPTLAVRGTTRYEGNLLNRLSLSGFIFCIIGFLVPNA